MPTSVDVSVIIVNYNVQAFLKQALQSLYRAIGDLTVEVFVVDNNSVDGSVEMVRTQFPEVNLIVNKENVGFGRANNQALRQACGRYVFILNPDTRLQEDTLLTLVQFMDSHPEAGAVGCKLVNPDGSFAPESRRAFPTPAVAFYRLSGLSKLFPKSPLFGQYNLTYLPENEVSEVDALSGSCMFVRRVALHYSWEEYDQLRQTGQDPDTEAPVGEAPVGKGAGYFDEAFFMYGEDLDWCYRIKQAGWKIYYTPHTQIIHYKGESTRKSELRYVRHFYGAMLAFAQKHFAHRYSRLFAGLIRVGIFLRGGLTALGTFLQRLLWPAMDFLVVWLITSLWMVGWGKWTGTFAPEALLRGLPLLYAGSMVLVIFLIGGYRLPAKQWRISPIWIAGILSGVGLAVGAFFVKELAYSRVVLIGSMGSSIVALTLMRVLGKRIQQKRWGLPRAVLVGTPQAAINFEKRWRQLIVPSFEWAGYVRVGDSNAPVEDKLALGALHQIRDVVRLHRIQEVILDAGSLSNTQIITLIQQLRDLPVQFKILAEGQQHLIAKSSVDVLEIPLVEAERLLPALQHPWLYRLEVLGISGIGIVLYPVCWLGMWGKRRTFFQRMHEKIKQLPDVWRGKRMLVGYSSHASWKPPAEWGIKPGVFDVLEGQSEESAPETVQKAYAYYAGHRSLGLDLQIIWRILLRWWNNSDLANSR